MSTNLPTPILHGCLLLLPFPPPSPLFVLGRLAWCQTEMANAQCVNQRSAKCWLLAERATKGNMTLSVTLEQKKHVVSSPLAMPSVPSNKEKGESEQTLWLAEGNSEAQPWQTHLTWFLTDATQSTLFKDPLQ